MKVKSLVEQIDSCKFECEGGPLANNVAWVKLRQLLIEGPAYLPGQVVSYPVTLKSEATGFQSTSDYNFQIAGIHVTSDDVRLKWEYDLAIQLPGAYYSGSIPFRKIKEDDIKPTPIPPKDANK